MRKSDENKTKDDEVQIPINKKIPEKKKRDLTGSFLLIFIGSILLLNNFGILPWGIWRDLWRLWPLLLIFWGLQLIFHKSKIGTAFITLIILLIVCYFFLIGIASTNEPLRDYLKNQFPFLTIPTYEETLSPFEREERSNIFKEEDYIEQEFYIP